MLYLIKKRAAYSRKEDLMFMLNGRKKWLYFFLLLVFITSPTPIVYAGNMENPRQEPTAIGDGGAVASEHPDASQAAIDMMEKGGNAIDAAIAAAAVQGVTRPFSGGIGGGGIMNVYLKESDKNIIIDHRTESSRNFGPTAFMNPETGKIFSSSTRTNSGMSTAVPSAVKAWEKALNEYGTMSLSEVLEPAIEIAETGFEADENFIRETQENADRFRLFKSTRDIYLNQNGEVPKVGSVMKNPDLAKTYRLIAKHGSGVFYEGEIAQSIIDTIQHPPAIDGEQDDILAGNMILEDLKDYDVIENEPTHVTYHGYDIYGAQPPSSGGTTIGEILNILEPYHLKNLNQKDAMHYYLEASRYAYADRSQYLGDPSYTDNPMIGLLSKGYATERRQLIKDDRASIGQVASGNPWPYEGNPEKQPDPPSDSDEVFYYDFTGKEGAAWDRNAFDRMDTGVVSDPFDAEFSIENNTGRIKLNKRKEDRGSAYGRAVTTMEAVGDSELLIRFRFDEANKNQRLRLWLQGDSWASGSTMPRNGYGIELNANTNQLLLRNRQDNVSTIMEQSGVDFNNDWHWLRYRIEDGQLSVRLWNDESEEPNEWNMKHRVSEGEELKNDIGYFLLGAINFDYNGGNNIYFDEIYINKLRSKTSNADKPGQVKQRENEERERGKQEEQEKSTIHLSVNDQEGNIVSYTSTIVSIGGNGMVVPGYGFLLNDALAGRIPTKNTDHPNYPRPNFKSLSSMSPTIVMKDGVPVMTVGAPGSATIITTVTQVMLNHLDFGMTLPEAIESPRLTQRNRLDGKTEYEEVFMTDYGSLLDELQSKGHQFKADTRIQGIGSVTGLEFLSDHKVRAAAEPVRRGGGSAMALDVADIDPPTEHIKVLLQEKVNQIKDEELRESVYTETSWKAFQTAHGIAQNLLDTNEEQLQDSILEKALSNLIIAYDALEKKNKKK